MSIKFSELIIKLADYQDMFKHLGKAVNDEFAAFLSYAAANGSCKDERIKKEFDEHAKEEYEHALKFYKIIQDLGGNYFLESPMNLISNVDCGYISPFGTQLDVINDNIKGENCAIVSYSMLLDKFEFSKEHREIIESIIDDEKKHVKDLLNLVKHVKEQHINKVKN